jgi:transposase
MDIVNPRCAGLDVHQAIVVVCRLLLLPGGELQEEVRKFRTVTADLLAMSDWLREGGATVVAMESTGVYWKPIWNLLEGQMEVLLVNARHIKQVPGRKTDVKDCQWIAQLLQHGLLRASFVPPAPVREWRDLTRHRAKLVSEKTAVANRIHKVLEDANIKLSSVATDVLGSSGRAMIRALMQGETDPTKLAALAQGRLREKEADLKLALEGRVTAHHRFMLATLWDHLEFLERQIDRINQRLEELTRPFADSLSLLVTIPGIKMRAAENLLAEIGCDPSIFPTGQHLASWAGVCPGNNESAGKRKSGKTPKGNRWLRSALTEAAWAASRTKNTYLAAQYRRLAARRGKKRALVAVAHTLLTIIWAMLTRREPYRELGPAHFEKLHPEQLTRYLVRRLERLGHKVELHSLDTAGAAA